MPPRPAPGFDGEYATVNLADHLEMNHVTIDKMLTLHRAILPKFVEAVSLGSPPGSGGVPIEYRVPAGVPIEVWDSGMAVRATPGDTAWSVAHQFSVPTWVIAQLNQLMPLEAIEPGRHARRANDLGTCQFELNHRTCSYPALITDTNSRRLPSVMDRPGGHLPHNLARSAANTSTWIRARVASYSCK